MTKRDRLIAVSKSLLGAVIAGQLVSCGKPGGTVQMPPQHSTLAADVDWLYYFLFWISVVSFVLIVGVMLWFVWKYRRRAGVRAEPTGHSTKLEIFWTFSPLILLVLLFHWGFDGFMKGMIAPADALEVRVRGKQWSWEFEYPNGAVETGTLRVPVNTPVKLIMSSADVIHSFFVPAFRVKRDVVPGMYSTLWFEATELTPAQKTGGETVVCEQDSDCASGYGCVANVCSEYEQVYCTEYCGAPPGAEGNAGHSAMLARVVVQPAEDFQKFMDEGPGPPPNCPEGDDQLSCWGEQLYAQNQCNTCHNVDGVTMAPAPNFKGLWGRSEQLADGSQIEVVGEVGLNYIRESILQPQAKVVSGYTNVVMPPYRLSDRQIDAMIAYIRSLSEEP